MFVTTYRSASEVNNAMIRVYNYMAVAIFISAIVAGMVSSSTALMAVLFDSWFKWVIIFSPIFAILGISVALNADPPKYIALTMLYGFAALMGLSLSVFFFTYTSSSLVMAFISTSILFGTMSLYGYFTKRSLQSLGQFLFVGLITLIIASVINIFVGSTLLQMTLSAIAIIIFLGLTAYDTQRLREMVSADTTSAVEVSGALSLYMNFINIFINLLQLFGGKKE